MPYIQQDERIEIFTKIEEFYNNNDKYLRKIKYFKKTWLNNSYFNYEEITQKEYLNRTNNLLEYFHHLLNQNIEVFHPKFSYLVEKFIFFIKNIYIKIKESLVNEIPNTINKFTIILFIKL